MANASVANDLLLERGSATPSIWNFGMKRPGSAPHPLWYKDAILYELHVRAFMDGNGDGIGDFPGLLQKLDYLQDLGVTCLWLLPFFPSPLRDDGYDISDYTSVHPSYGTMDDFSAFLAAAHDRGLQVMIELVMNHTSDQHPWFQAARRAPAGSPERDFYVWSDTDQKYRDARIIFTDTEKSNWTWDPVAQAYFWHRFFSHQPDLNYDNPRVVEEMLKVLRYWLDLGVDALRVDAIPYLIEREGTSCENLPETHALVRRVRHEIEENYSNRMILAEANQWPTDVRPYFGAGDECHMAFHFPLMPRIYMALRQEDRLPITDIMAETPDIPDACQWALFLRNHDELTLEMVTNDERDYMYLAYSADPRMRLNLGIRRRLAPLLDNNRRRIELLNSLLLSFPGTPILYYGDEIGMGDNIYLGDRNGVRTPMQWNSDRNAGFSRATPARLYSPVIMDPVWGYEAVNVEAGQSDPSSLLNWMRNMIALRKLFRVFGRGTLQFLNPANRKVLAYVRRYDGEQVLCVANLSRFAQPVDLDLSELEGMVPVEMLGYVEFPAIGKQPYRLTLGAYSFLWLELHGTPESAEAQSEPEAVTLTTGTGWASLFEGAARHRFETAVLPEYLSVNGSLEWNFGEKLEGETRKIRSVQVLDWATLNGRSSALALVEARCESGAPVSCFLPLAIAFGKAADRVRERAANAVLADVVTPEGAGLLHDGVWNDDFCAALLALIQNARESPSRRGSIRGIPALALRHATGTEPPLAIHREPGSSAILYAAGDEPRWIVKMFRRFQPGPNPDCEISRYLTESAHFDRTLPFGGSIEYQSKGAEPATLAMLQDFVANEGDAWKWTLEEIERYFENCAAIPFPEGPSAEKIGPPDLASLWEEPVPPFARDHVGIYLESAATLGRRTAELHRALACPSQDPAFSAEPMTLEALDDLCAVWLDQAKRAFDLLKESLTRLPDEAVEPAGLVLGRRRRILDRLRISSGDGAHGLRIRIHGNYHLGQVLRERRDFLIVDFDGELARPIEERRAKQSPLKDVASMLRSFSYGALTTLVNYTARRGEDFARLEPWARLWERSVSGEFLRAYHESAQDAGFLPPGPEEFRRLLGGFWLDKTLYELMHELKHRPAWARIPLMGILSFPR